MSQERRRHKRVEVFFVDEADNRNVPVYVFGQPDDEGMYCLVKNISSSGVELLVDDSAEVPQAELTLHVHGVEAIELPQLQLKARKVWVKRDQGLTHKHLGCELLETDQHAMTQLEKLASQADILQQKRLYLRGRLSF